MGEIYSWLQFIIVVIGLISVFLRIGNSQGKQQEKNKNVEKKLDIHDKKIDILEANISEIKSDLSYIKGRLLPK